MVFYTVNGAAGDFFSKSPCKTANVPSKITFFRACGEPQNGRNTRIASNRRVITKSPEILKIPGLLTKGGGQTQGIPLIRGETVQKWSKNE